MKLKYARPHLDCIYASYLFETKKNLFFLGYRHIKLSNKHNKGTLFVGIKIESSPPDKTPINLSKSPVEHYEVFEKSNFLNLNTITE